MKHKVINDNSEYEKSIIQNNKNYKSLKHNTVLKVKCRWVNLL